MIPAGQVWIVQKKNIAPMHVRPIITDDGSNCKSGRPGVNGNSISLRHNRAVRSGKEAGEVVRLAENRAACGAHHYPAHVLSEVIEAILHDRKGHRIRTIHVRLIWLLPRANANQVVAEAVHLEQIVRRDHHGGCRFLYNHWARHDHAGRHFGAWHDRCIDEAAG